MEILWRNYMITFLTHTQLPISSGPLLAQQLGNSQAHRNSHINCTRTRVHFESSRRWARREGRKGSLKSQARQVLEIADVKRGQGPGSVVCSCPIDLRRSQQKEGPTLRGQGSQSSTARDQRDFLASETFPAEIPVRTVGCQLEIPTHSPPHPRPAM